MVSVSLRTKSYHDANAVFSRGSGSCHNDNNASGNDKICIIFSTCKKEFAIRFVELGIILL